MSGQSHPAALGPPPNQLNPQTRPHSEVLGVRTATRGLGGYSGITGLGTWPWCHCTLWEQGDGGAVRASASEVHRPATLMATETLYFSGRPLGLNAFRAPCLPVRSGGETRSEASVCSLLSVAQ